MKKDCLSQILQALEALQTDIAELKNSIQPGAVTKVNYTFSEMLKKGYPPGYLETAYLTPGQDFATKLNPAYKNSKIIFNMPKFEAWQKRQIKAQIRR